MCDSKAEPRTDNDKLCSCCQYMIQVTTLARPFPHHQKTQELRESAQRGCPICVQLWECYFNDAEEFESIRLSFALYNDAKDCDFSYSFYKDYPGSPVGEEIDKKALVGTFTARPADGKSLLQISRSHQRRQNYLRRKPNPYSFTPFCCPQ